MATSSPTITYDVSTDAAYRTMASDFDTALLAVGLTAVSQTGEMNFATATKPTAGNQQRDFRCYKWNDGLTEIFLKVGFGAAEQGSAGPGIFFSFGRTLNGSGTFTGSDASSVYQMNLTSGNAALGAVTTRFCMSGSALAISFNEALGGTGARQIVAMFDRSHTEGTGAANATAFTAAFASANWVMKGIGGSASGNWVETVPVGSAGTAINGKQHFAAPNTTATWSVGTDLGISRIEGWHGRGYPMLAGIVYSPTDASVGTSITATLWGSSHTFRASGTSAEQVSGSNRGFVAHIWE